METITRARNPPSALSVREFRTWISKSIRRLQCLKPAMPLALAMAVTSAMGCRPTPPLDAVSPEAAQPVLTGPNGIESPPTGDPGTDAMKAKRTRT